MIETRQPGAVAVGITVSHQSVTMEASALGQGGGDGSYPNFADLVLRHLEDLEGLLVRLEDHPHRQARAPR